jgi:drug/metabolite transporter (DMT)-like permease
MYLQIFSKLISESLLSLYPIFVKYINLPIGIQIWSRFFTYFIVSCLFINGSFIIKNIFSTSGLLLSLTTILHVYSSYRGFQILESGIAYMLFYTYPLMILLLSGEKIHSIFIFALLGVILLSQEKIESYENKKTGTDKENTNEKDEKNGNDVFKKREVKENFKYEGVLMILLAAFTEALIYFIVRNIKTNNHWNHLFISYGLGALLMSFYFFKDIQNINISTTINVSMLINLVLGLFGYLTRFYAITNLNVQLYSSLSYFGVLMAFIYGILINKDIITVKKILGSILIILPNIYLLF